MDAATARLMAGHKQWANRLMFDAVAALPPGEAEKPRPSLFRNMVHTLNHNHVIDRIWQAHIEGREHGYQARNTEDCPPLDELRAQQQDIDAWYLRWADGLDDAGFARTVEFTLIGGNRGAMTCGEILMHVVTHASYHRGYVADMIYDIPGRRPPTMDLPVYMREGRAAV
jgi:uncharacterized damage-inducible protein DinB